MINIQDSVNEYRKPLQLLYDCHGLMFESQLSDLLGYNRRKTNRLVKNLKTNKLVKVTKTRSCNIVSLTKSAAKELVAPNPVLHLPEPDSTAAVWLGAYASDFLKRHSDRFVLPSHYKQAFHNTFSEVFLSKQQEAQQKLSLEREQNKLVNQVRSAQVTEFIQMRNFISKTKQTNPLALTQQLLTKLDEAQQSLLIKTLGSTLLQDLKAIVESQQKSLAAVDADLLKAIQFYERRAKEYKDATEIKEPTLPTIPEIFIPDGAYNLPYQNISPSDNASLATSKLTSKNSLYIILPRKLNVIDNWAGVGNVNNKRWLFAVLDRGYTITWYRNLLLQIALSSIRYDTARGCFINPPKDKITFDLVILCPNEARHSILQRKLDSLTQDNYHALKTEQPNYFTFADVKHSSWGLKQIHFLNLNTERLFQHPSQKLIPLSDLPTNQQTQAGTNPR
ncbi:MAG: hypothetical protein HYR87_07345 [Thaumarchaeota archaeon]|nr:hypothetical protein [Nitrososphaerota archaeon]